MLSEGADVPRFELPALVDGEKRRVELGEYLGDDVVILAFYPADFNPACDAESCDLDELDLFTMQKDVRILGISPDSVYSHRAFARQYDLKVPLLSDTDGEVAERYDIELVDDIGQRLVERAVAVVDHDGTITYSWSTDDMTELPRVEEIKDALAETGGDDTAFARYRVGHAHYTEGRRSFTSAMQAFEEAEWMMAQHDFQQAREEFEAAADRFDTALRFVDDESLLPIYEGANEKATALWQAADWLTDAASAYSSGNGAEGQKLRDDAEIPLSTVREYAEPPDPDGGWPPEVTDLERAETDDRTILPTEPEVEDAALDVDIDEEVTDSATEGDAASDDSPADGDAPVEADDGTVAGSADAEADDADADGDFDDEELAEIQAELAANNPESEPSVEEVTAESTAIVEAPPMPESDDGSEESMDDDADEAADDAPGAAATEAVDAAVGDSPDGTGGAADTDQPAGETATDEPAVEPAEGESADTSDTSAAEQADEAGPEPVEGTPADQPAETDEATAAPAADGDTEDEPVAVDADARTDDMEESADADDAKVPAEPVATDDGDESAGDADADEDDEPDVQFELVESDPQPIDERYGDWADEEPAADE